MKKEKAIAEAQKLAAASDYREDFWVVRDNSLGDLPSESYYPADEYDMDTWFAGVHIEDIVYCTSND